MTSSSVTAFCKRSDCPAAESLLAYRARLISKAEGEAIARHLDECEFCGAELQLLVRCPAKEECCKAAEVPPYLKILFEVMIGAQISIKDLHGRSR